MKFYLDKEQAKQGTACCFWKSETNATDEELELVRKHFDFKGEFLIFEGVDIPHKFKYNKELDTIEEVIEIVEDTPLTLSDEVKEIESDFDESVEIDPEKQYFYLDKTYADKFHKSQVIAVFPQPLKNPNQYFQKEVYSHFGKDIPFYISIDENRIVREATEYEKYQRGQRKLTENEIVLKEKIVVLEDGQYLDDEKHEIITVPCPPEYLVKEWHRETHTWEDLTTDYDRVQAQYREYEGMDTPSTLKEMELQDPTLSNEYLNMMIELRGLMYSLKSNVVLMSEVIIPEPSQKLEKFKNRFNKFF